MNRLIIPILFAAGAIGAPTAAHATEVTWEGHYRTRAELFDSLSVSKSNAQAEGTSLSFNHRLRLQPGFLINANASIHTQLDILPYTLWGDEPDTSVNPVGGEETPVAFSEGIVPTTTEDGGVSASTLRVTRAWAQVDTDIGQFRLGRMPVEWGSGMVFNAGNDLLDEYGDSADRLQLASRVGPIYLLGAFEINDEGFVGEPDDTQTLTGAILYKSEVAGLGSYNTYRYYGFEEDTFGAFTTDLWAYGQMGPARAELELAGVFGGGDLDTGANDVTLGAYGGALDLSFESDRLLGGLGLGFATGDADPDDKRLKTFVFDRDFNQTLLLFEEPIPVLEAAVVTESNGGRDMGAVRTGNALQNLLYLKPTVGWAFREDLTGKLSLFASQAAKLPEAESDSKGYGLELDAHVDYEPFEHTFLNTTIGTWFPGAYFENYSDPSLGGGFDRTVVGVRVIGGVQF